jgi:uncharacterized membrane protein YeaQ/YmgE (transglycosylase-associated protein family)
MNPPPQSPWPSIVKVVLILGCTITFCILGLIAGVLAAKVLTSSGNAHGQEVLMTVLIPPTVGSLFGLTVGLISALFVRWNSRKNLPVSTQSTGTSPVQS